ncbi:MAG: hypothetical protein JXR64_13135 [Spirochaetales bacterium]|nr:hypothetical protein [Spirochaetales bacterium]
MFYAVVGISIYILFFILFPGMGAINLRRKWGRFRDLVFKYSNVPDLGYHNILEGETYCFRGELESFKNDDVVWLKGETLSVCINLKKLDVYTLSERKEILKKYNWSDISSIVEGTKFYVFGKLELISSVPYLVGSKNEELLVVISENEKSIFEMLIKKGRDRNEIWNNSSPYFYITGVLILIIISYVSYKTNFNKTTAFYLLLAAGTPFYFILPPGLFFYYKYRKTWEQSIRYSILKDLKRLRGDSFSSFIMGQKGKSRERLSLLFYLTGYILNISIAGIILYNLFLVILYR